MTKDANHYRRLRTIRSLALGALVVVILGTLGWLFL
jgi:hypothetical protein